MKIKAIVEKGSDGRYSVYSNQHIGNSYFGGFGETVGKAKADFRLSIQEAISEQMAEGKETPDFDSISLEYRYDLPSFFNYFDFINVSKFAEYAGINESKMRAYKSGITYPGEKTTAKIFEAIRNIGADLCASTLLQYPDAPAWMHIAVSAGIVFISIILAWGILKIYDEPVREWLKDHWLIRQPSK